MSKARLTHRGGSLMMARREVENIVDVLRAAREWAEDR